jgi:hypothetical protein
MSQPAANHRAAKQHLERIVIELIEYREHITFAQLRRILAEAVPLRLSGALLLAFGTLLCSAFGLGWHGYRMFGGDQPPIEQPSPEETVSQYYALLSSGQHGKAWKILAKGQYEPWVRYWTTVEHISVSDMVTINETENQAIVEASLKYLKKDGLVVNELTRLYLVRESEGLPWKISKGERLKAR